MIVINIRVLLVEIQVCHKWKLKWDKRKNNQQDKEHVVIFMIGHFSFFPSVCVEVGCIFAFEQRRDKQVAYLSWLPEVYILDIFFSRACLVPGEKGAFGLVFG